MPDMCRYRRRLIDDRVHHLGMGVSGGVDGNAGRTVEEAIAVDVFDDGAGSAGHDEGIAARVRRRHEPLVPFNECRGVRTGQRCLEIGACIVDCPAWCDRTAIFASTRAGRRIFQHDAPLGKLVANPVGRGEVPILPRRLPGLDETLDLLRPRPGGRASSARRSDSTPRTRSKRSKASRMTGTSPAPTCPSSIDVFSARIVLTRTTNGRTLPSGTLTTNKSLLCMS